MNNFGVKALLRICSFLAVIAYGITAHAVTQLSIHIGQIEHATADAKNVMLELNLQKVPLVTATGDFKHKVDKAWTQLDLRCDFSHSVRFDAFDCEDSLLKNTSLRLPFSLKVNRLLNRGMLDLDASLQLKNASFSDEAGLHAAEKLTGNLDVALKRSGQDLVWRTVLDWQSGEMFWQPFYIESGGHQLTANGTLNDGFLNVDAAHLKIKNVGELDVDGQLRLSDYQLVKLNANLPSLDLSAAYPLLFKPILEKTALNNADMAGNVSLKLYMDNSELKSFELRLNDVDIADRQQKFAFYKVNANIPWSYDAAKSISFGYENGSLLNLPLGKTNINAELNRFALTSPNIRLPVLDGALNLSDISAARIGGAWFWHLRAGLEPISMEDLSRSLNLPSMSGKASAEIPLVTYSAGNLTTDGSLVLNVFSGTATVTGLTMQNPLGVAPKLNADIALRNLDLGDLTRTFSFGAIEGKLDGDINDLELQNWKPVKFDAKVQSSPGNYRKKISQRAVENISALGGGGAAAAVQRSFLRFFEQFNYGKMGLSCSLRDDICQMGGVESTAQGYVIVKGSGIPAITVMGYNQTVGWSELLARIKRVTDGNSRAIVK